MDLESIRHEIDGLDKELVALLEKRMNLVSKVVAYKRSTGKQVLDKGREQAILDKVAGYVEDKHYEETIVNTFASIMRRSREYQQEHLS